MMETDPVLARLSELGAPPLDPALSARVETAALARLVPRRVSLLLGLAVSASVVSYLAWALLFTARLYER